MKQENDACVRRTLSEERTATKAQMSDPHFCGGTVTKINDSHFTGYGPSEEELEIRRNRGW